MARVSKDIDEITSYMKTIANGDKELEKYIYSLIGATLNEPLSPIIITNELISDVRKKYG